MNNTDKVGLSDKMQEYSDLISIVVPCLNEQDNIRALYQKLFEIIRAFNWELILVDDGSSDRTFEVIMQLAAAESRVRGLKFSRNFGHQYALLAGLNASRGQAVISMDADLQHPPELIPEMLRSWKEGYSIVRTKRNDSGELSWFKKHTSSFYYKVFSYLSGIKMEEGASDFRLLDRRVVKTILSMQEADLFLRGLEAWVGFKQKVLPYKVRPRYSGKSKYSIRKMLKFAASGITSFSTIPLRLGILLGFVTSFLSFLEILYVFWAKVRGVTVPGWTSMTALLSFLFGITFILMGLLGIYIGHIFRRVQNRSLYIIEQDTNDYAIKSESLDRSAIIETL
jgi:glycosyltransferase involved in cell wall biosynthesis